MQQSASSGLQVVQQVTRFKSVCSEKTNNLETQKYNSNNNTLFVGTKPVNNVTIQQQQQQIVYVTQGLFRHSVYS